MCFKISQLCYLRIKSKPLNFGRPETYPIRIQPSSSSLASYSLPFSPNSHTYAHSHTQACLHLELLHGELHEVPAQLQAFVWKALPFLLPPLPSFAWKTVFLVQLSSPVRYLVKPFSLHGRLSWLCLTELCRSLSLWQLYFIYPYISSMWHLFRYMVDAQ